MKYFTSSPGPNTNVLAVAIAQLIYFIFGIIEMLLAFRFVFKILGANSASPFVDLIYDFSSIFLSPFANIFPRTSVRTDIGVSVFEPETIIAILIYGLLAHLTIQALNTMTVQRVVRVE